WVFPVSILVIIQVRLYQYGHDLDPGAAFRMDGFTPKVIGPTKVWNFTAMSMPGSGIIVLLLAAATAAFGPRLLQWMQGKWGRTTVLLLTTGLAFGGLVPPASAQHEHHGHDHGPSGPVDIGGGEGTLL